MTRWEAAVEIVKSFNSRGSPLMALASLVIIVGLPSAVIAFGLMSIPEQMDGSISQLIAWAGG